LTLCCKVLFMTSPSDSVVAAASREREAATSVIRPDAPSAHTLLLQAALLGLSGDALLYQAGPGPGLAIWVAVLALATMSLTWGAGRRMPREAAAWLGAAIVFTTLTAWRDSGALQFLDVVTAIAALGLAAISLRDPALAIWAPRLRDTVWAGAAIVGNVMRGIVPLALRELFAADRHSGWMGRTRTGARMALIAGILLLVFGSLLRSADPIFARLVALPDLDFETIASHTIVAGFFAWIAGGWAYGALMASPTSRRAPDRLPFTLNALDVATALGTLNVLFGAYVLTQLGWFFGGERFLHATTGLTAAQYARQGFFQMVWVVVLVVPLLLATRAALAPGDALARRHTLLSLPIVGLLGAIVLSAALRMRLYVHYYGLTTDRLFTLVFMGWLTIVLALLAATVLRGRGRGFVAGSVISGLTLLAGLHIVVPDLVVARVNIARAANASPGVKSDLDLPHLASLSGDAIPLAVAATLAAPSGASATATAANVNAQRCDAASRLLWQWGPVSRAAERRRAQGAWRSWNAGETAALQSVGANSAALRRLRHATCAPGRGAGNPFSD
jgi:hypothetical protein